MERITIRLGNLAEPLEQAAAAAGMTPGEWAKRALARTLKVKLERYEGNMAIGEQARKGAQARWHKE